MTEAISPEILREVGKAYFFGETSDKEKKSHGLKLIIDAQKRGDPEAQYLVAKLLLDGVLQTSARDPEERILTLMCGSANGGCLQARAHLNAYCEDRYSKRQKSFSKCAASEGELTDFEGKRIRISRQGLLTPVDAILEYKDGKNILTLSTNVVFLYCTEIPSFELLEKAVIDGIKAWEGEYEVFCGQQLTVKVNVTREDRLFDNIVVMPLTDNERSSISSINRMFKQTDDRVKLEKILDSRRSFATAGVKWSSTSRKIICIQSPDERFDNYDEMLHIVKHEFGHALGLGDLYQDPVCSFEGVAEGTYSELDSYIIRDKFYNLVMCDHHGPISNNDIEMVVLAFRNNKIQQYQPGKFTLKVSEALGRGN